MTDTSFYRAQADKARAEADAADLANVRDRHLRSAAAFDAMVERTERVATTRAARQAATETHKDQLLEHPQ